MSRRIYTSASGEAYSYEIFDRDLSTYELKNLGEIAVWWEYKRMKRFPSSPNHALQELFARHDGLLRQLAQQSHQIHNHLSEYDDKLQHARCGALLAYERFDLNKAQAAGGRLSTFVRSTVFRHLQSSNDEDSFIVCPPTRRALRNYLNGRYDNNPLKKSEIEGKLGVRTVEDTHRLRRDFSTLVSKFHSLEHATPVLSDETVHFEDVFAGTNMTESDILDRIQIERIISDLTPRQQDVLARYHSGQESVESIADSLGLSQSAIRNDIKAAQKALENRFAADNITHV